MRTIFLNLAGATVIVGYTPKFHRLSLYDNDWKCWHPIGKKGLTLDCGRTLKKSDLVLTIKHKLGIV
jgi:hypothetical protein